LGELCRADALLAPILDARRRRDRCGRTGPERSLGMHFFSPAHAMKLLEVVRGAKTSDQSIARAVALGSAWAKFRSSWAIATASWVTDVVGYKREAEFLVLAARRPRRSTRPSRLRLPWAPSRFGFGRHDVGWRAKRERIERGAAPRFALTDLTDKLVAPALGQKTAKAGTATNPARANRFPTPRSTRWSRPSAANADDGASVSDDEIVQRCVYALVNEGARILAEGVAASAATSTRSGSTATAFRRRAADRCATPRYRHRDRRRHGRALRRRRPRLLEARRRAARAVARWTRHSSTNSHFPANAGPRRSNP